MSEKQLFGWYSKKAVDAGHGTAIWSTPEGGTVEVTAVHPSDRNDDYEWPDKKPLGKVCKCLGVGRKDRIGSIYSLR